MCIARTGVPLFRGEKKKKYLLRHSFLSFDVETAHSSIFGDIMTLKCHGGRHIFLERVWSQHLKTAFAQILALHPGPGGLRKGGEQGEPLQPWGLSQMS